MLLSRRHIPHMVAITLLSLVPIGIHKQLDMRRDECADPFRLVPATMGTPERAQREHFMQKRLSAHQWKEGRLPHSDGLPQIHYAIVRSYEAKLLYYRLERRMLGRPADRVETVQVASGAVDLPVRVAHFFPKPGSSAAQVASYLLVYDGQPVGDPYLSQLLGAPARLLTGSLPMTAFFASAVVSVGERKAVQQRQLEWLEESWREYRAICFPRDLG